MEFAQPFAKSLLSLTHLKLKVFQACSAANQALSQGNEDGAQSTPLHSLSNQATSSEAHPASYPNVFTMRKSQTRGSSRQQPARKAAVDDSQRCLPLAVEAGKDEPAVRTLKIVQREPRKQPECLLISGRMADVCAALERMARNERALQA